MSGRDEGSSGVSRRNFLRAGLGGTGLLGIASLGVARGPLAGGPLLAQAVPADGHDVLAMGMHPMPAVVGEVDHARNGFNPTNTLIDFDGGMVSSLPTGQTLREFTLVAQTTSLEIVPGVAFAAWTYNGRIPGPTIRVGEGDRVRIAFRNDGDHPHSVHFHGVHPGLVDGVFDMRSGVVAPGKQHIYEFDAEPFGLHMYHCHTAPLAKHIAKGLYGAFIIDPKGGRPPVDRELIMVMSGYDVDFDGSNDFYFVNGIPFHYDKHPIELRVGERVRLYLANALEYDVSNSFHLRRVGHHRPGGQGRSPATHVGRARLDWRGAGHHWSVGGRPCDLAAALRVVSGRRRGGGASGGIRDRSADGVEEGCDEETAPCGVRRSAGGNGSALCHGGGDQVRPDRPSA